MDKRVFVSEAEIAYWGCVYPSKGVQPKVVYREKFLGRDVEVYVYDFPHVNDFLHFRSIEQNLSIGVNEPITSEALRRPVRIGYRIMAYCSLMKEANEILRYAHSAIQFARCFRIPPKPRGSGGMSEGLMKVHTLHAERLQHVSGMKDMTTAELKKRLCSRGVYGITFGHFVLQACRRGILQMPVEVVRLWLAEAFDPASVREFMMNSDYQFGVNLCIFCQVRVPRPALCIVKLGDRWARVSIHVSEQRDHAAILDVDDISNEGISIVFEVDHVIRYSPSEMIQLHDIRLARIFRWFHRFLKCVLFNLWSTDYQYANRVMTVLLRVIHCMSWETQDRGILFRLLRAIKSKDACYGLDVQACCMHMGECMKYLYQDDGRLTREQTELLLELAAEADVNIRSLRLS